IETQHSQQARKSTEVRVRDEPDDPQGDDANAQQLADIERFEFWIDADAVAVPHKISEVDGFAIYQDQLDFGVRHTEGLDGVLDCRRSRAAIFEVALAPCSQQEIVQLFVEAELRERVLAG